MFVTSAFGCVVLVSLAIPTAEGIGCYSCTNVSSVSQCTQTTTCGSPGEMCRLEYTTVLNNKIFTLGCTNAVHCPKSTPGLVGRSTSSDSCTDCCATDNCNRQLCQEPDPTCIDTTGFDCFIIGATINYCDDPHRAQTYCKNFCGLCSLRDGEWSMWSQWSDCTNSCGNGTKSRLRACTNPPPTDGGDNCVGNANDVQTCTEKPCPVHGGWSSWSSWDSCSSTCDIGIQQRERSCTSPFPSADGNFCVGSFTNTQICVMPGCTDGGWSDWSIWNACSRTCGNGVNSRSRTCDNPTPSLTGRNCAGDPSQTQSCHVKSCNDGGWSAWSIWSVCSRSCGDGINSRSRTCDNPTPSTSGRYCVGDPLQAQLCHLTNCPDGGWSAWSTWSVCSRSCGDGINSRSRTCDNPTPSTSGRYCVGDPLQAQSCHLKTCPDGGWSAWSSWSVCSRSCGEGINSRSRSCDNPSPSSSGIYCAGDPTQTQSCKVRSCPVKLSAFTATNPTGDYQSILKFTSVVLNEGDNYNTSSGNFTCTIPGFYFFTLSLVKKRSSSRQFDSVDAYIRQNGSNKVQAFIDPDDGEADKGSYGVTASATLSLHAGDVVNVQGASASSMEDRSMFSGFIIQPDDN